MLRHTQREPDLERDAGEKEIANLGDPTWTLGQDYFKLIQKITTPEPSGAHPTVPDTGVQSDPTPNIDDQDWKIPREGAVEGGRDDTLDIELSNDLQSVERYQGYRVD